MLTWLIRPINCPAWGSSFAKSSVRPIINSPPPVEHKVAVRFLKASFTFSLGEYFFCLLAYDENMYCLVLRDKCYKWVLLSKSHLSFFNFRYRCFLTRDEKTDLPNAKGEVKRAIKATFAHLCTTLTRDKCLPLPAVKGASSGDKGRFCHAFNPYL